MQETVVMKSQLKQALIRMMNDPIRNKVKFIIMTSCLPIGVENTVAQASVVVVGREVHFSQRR